MIKNRYINNLNNIQIHIDEISFCSHYEELCQERENLFTEKYESFQEPEDLNTSKLNIENSNKESKKYNISQTINLFDDQTGYSSKIKLNNRFKFEIDKIQDFILDGNPKAQIKSNFMSKNTKINEDKMKPSGEKKLLGRKKKGSNALALHTKFTEDNLSRKFKHIIIDNLMKFINSVIKKQYNGNIGKGTNEKKLLKLNQKQITSSKADYNRNFLNTPIKIILSDTISTKFTKHSPNHNKILIEKLLNEDDEEKRILFTKIFNLSFLDCVKHFRGDVNINELKGFSGMDEVFEKFEKEENDFARKFKLYINDFERIIMDKKVRKSKKNLSQKSISTDISIKS